MTITCHTPDGTVTVPFVKGNTVLEQLESAGIPVNSHCRDGFCGACRCTVIDGSIDYQTDPLAFVDDNEMLPCCAIPRSDLVIKL